MNHGRNILRNVILMPVMLIAAGCAAFNTDLSATTVPQTCPTIPTCPTSAPVLYSSSENYMSTSLSSAADINISFGPDEKCTVEAPSTLEKGKQYYQIKVQDQAHATYGVIFQTLDEGKTIEDLLAYPDTAMEAPGWDHVFQENYVGPTSNSYYAEDFPTGQIYISCFISTTAGPRRILDYGPVEVR